MLGYDDGYNTAACSYDDGDCCDGNDGHDTNNTNSTNSTYLALPTTACKSHSNAGDEEVKIINGSETSHVNFVITLLL